MLALKTDHPTAARPATAPWTKVPQSLVFSLPPHLLATWLRVRSFDWGKGCTASLSTLSSETMSVRQLQRNIKELVARGLLRAQQRDGSTTVLWAIEPTSDDVGDGGGATPMSGEGRRPCRPKQISETRLQEKQQHQAVNAAVVVPSRSSEVPEEPIETQGDLLPLSLPEDLAVLPATKKGLSSSTLRRLVGQHGPEAVRSAVAVLADSYAGKSQIRAFGAALTAALKEGWTSARLEEQGRQERLERAVSAALPPEGTRWARRGAEVVRVVEVSDTCVRTPSGVIPRSQFPDWTWLAEDPEKTASQEAQEGPRNGAQVSQDPPKSPLTAVRAQVGIWTKLGQHAKARALCESHGLELDQVLGQQQA